MNPEFKKDPSSILDYTIDWTAWLPSGDTISSSSWTVDSGITNYADSNTTTAATIWLSGGTAGVIYKATNTIVTANGRTDQRTLNINVIDR
jgi:hypothetical protein